MVLKAKSESDLLVRRHWAGRDLTGGVGSREEKHKTQGNERGNRWDLASKQGHPSQLHALLGAEGYVSSLQLWVLDSHTPHPYLPGLLFVPYSTFPQQ